MSKEKETDVEVEEELLEETVEVAEKKPKKKSSPKKEEEGLKETLKVAKILKKTLCLRSGEVAKFSCERAAAKTRNYWGCSKVVKEGNFYVVKN